MEQHIIHHISSTAHSGSELIKWIDKNPNNAVILGHFLSSLGLSPARNKIISDPHILNKFIFLMQANIRSNVGTRLLGYIEKIDGSSEYAYPNFLFHEGEVTQELMSIVDEYPDLFNGDELNAIQHALRIQRKRYDAYGFVQKLKFRLRDILSFS